MKNIIGKPVPCSVGAIVPASIFMYGSILMEVTFRPVVFNNKPVEEAVINSHYVTKDYI
jgi:hypothetical protein